MMRETITATTRGNKTISLVRLLPGIVPAGSGERMQKAGWMVQVTYAGSVCRKRAGWCKSPTPAVPAPMAGNTAKSTTLNGRMWKRQPSMWR